MATIDKYQDIMDSREVIERMQELERDFGDLKNQNAGP